MANADLVLRILAKDDATSTLQKVGKAAAAAFSVAAVVEFGRQSVLAFAEAEKSQLKLADAYTRFPAMSNVALSSLRAFNTELMRKTGFDDDAIASGQAVLAQFRLTGQQVKDVTPLLIDYAAKMGTDIPEAASLLGKASLGNTRALKALGISYKATGDQAADFAAVQALVAEKVGGFAEQEANTAAGQLRKLSTAYDELQESVGSALAPALDELVTVMYQVSDVSNEAAEGMTAWWTLSNQINSSIGESIPTWQKLLDLMSDPGFASFQFFESLVPGLGTMTKAAEMAAGATEDAGAATEEAARHFGVMGDTAANTTDAIKDLQAALDKLGGKKLNLDEATSALKASYDAARKAAQENGKALSLNTEAGRANRKALMDIAAAADEAAQAYAENGKSAAFVESRTKEARSAFIAAAKAMGATGGEARALATQYGLIPKKVATRVEATGISAAISAAAILKQRWLEIINLPTAQLNAHYGVVKAAGGPVVGPGGPTDDAVPAMLSNGEYVIRASSVKRYGLAFLDAVNSGRAVGLRRGGRANRPRPGGGRGVAPPDVRQQYRDDVQADFEMWRDELLAAADEAAAAADDAAAALREGIASTVGRAQAFGSVTTVDVSSGDDIFAARRALNQALGTEGEGAARAALADAQNRSTPRYILEQVHKKLATMQAFGANIKRMLNVGYPVEIVTDLFRQGYDGARTAEILAAADPGTVAAFREAQAAINAAGNDLGVWAAGNLPLGPNGTTLQGTFQSASALAASTSALAAPYRAPSATGPEFSVNTAIYLDGRKIVEALQDYKRSIGNAPLGLS